MPKTQQTFTREFKLKAVQLVKICPANEADPFDLLYRKGFDVAGTNEPEPPDVAAIGEADMPAIRFKPPSCLLILD
ncbi:hypothetical protein KSF_003310 [Reticulibacter mediterranei]|uniref:Uncharacterized protein n=1 Tax=Reticulibacter mediterranei TaxID=2778369 RepID=A0A8J3ID24_9CHLR|nr:hypothetical protein KSF_003310 [Reticulibacter mediterranei]